MERPKSSVLAKFSVQLTANLKAFCHSRVGGNPGEIT